MWPKKKNICTKATNQNFIHMGMKNRLNALNVCYHSVLNILPSNLLFKSHTDQTPPVILYACKTLFHMFKEQRLSVSENRVPGKIFLTKWQNATGNRDSCTMRSNSITVCSCSHTFLGWPGRLRWVWNVAHIGITRIYTKSGQKTLRTVVPKVWSAVPKGSLTSSQRINGYIPVIDTEFYSFFN